MRKIRSPIVDGIFYPDDGEALTERTQELLSDAPDPNGDAGTKTYPGYYRSPCCV